MTLVIGADLGTSGCKAAIFDEEGRELASTVHEYPTLYPAVGFHEQRPLDWWRAVREGIRELVSEVGTRAAEIAAISISGQSLAPIPLDEDNELLVDAVPIWSDTRAETEAEAYFTEVDQVSWYRRTGNGFPAPLYTIFKIMWMRSHQPQVYARIHTVIGSKDWINYQLTGRLCTDPSYASGFGAFDLLTGEYVADLLEPSGIPAEWLPSIIPSSDVVGALLPSVAEDLDLPSTVQVFAGGVDNSCMALGAGNTRPGRIYAALGSSSWLTLCDSTPIVEADLRPFVFAHVIPGLFNSAVSTFSSGTSATWAAQTLLGDVSIDELVRLGSQVSPGADGLMFIPSINGGTVLEGGPNVRGSLVQLSGAHGPQHIARAVLEGIPLALRRPLDRLRKLTDVQQRMTVTGGGARSDDWLQIYADILDCSLVKTNVDQQTATLGAAAVALVGMGMWSDFDVMNRVHDVISEFTPDPAATGLYQDQVLPLFEIAADAARDLGARAAEMTKLRVSSSPSMRD